MESKSFVYINLDYIEQGLQLIIDNKVDDTLFIADDALKNGEAVYQLIEGFTYDYEFKQPGYEFKKDLIVQPHSRKKHLGTISPSIYVGTLALPVFKNDKEVGKVELEVQSLKAGYRDDYRDMLELITEKCTDLLMQANSPVSHNFETDFEKDNDTLYQKFAFIKSIIATDEFAESIHRIVSSPVTQWKETVEQKDIRNIRRFKNSNIKELITCSNRTGLTENHFLQKYGLQSLPGKIFAVRKSDTVDTSENRFVKFALESFLKFCSDINKKAEPETRLRDESGLLEKELESFLHHSVFKQISHPETLRLNSPVLQRKEGYREVLRVWLMFDLAAKLIWKGGDDIYSGGKKDIATLYEYWLFFKLLDLFQSIFDIEPKDISDLIKETPDGLNLQIKQGKFTALKGVYDSGGRKLNIRFNYNRTFSGKKTYPDSGSWTTTLRPDYTLSFWPFGISEVEAEKQELIVHVHFDAKYKVANLIDFFEQNTEDEINEEKEENRKGIYKNADLLKMHAYKDAIRRTGGAYILYPGDKSINQRGFHEIIPGLGAFPVKPSKTDSGIGELKAFILEIIEHFINRASQREKIAFRTFDIYKNPPESDNVVNDPLPEPYDTNRDLIPDETHVLVGYYNSQEQYNWIQRTGLYNFRMGSGAGSLILDEKTVSSKYLLLHTSGDLDSGDLWKIVSRGPKVYSKDDLIKKGYPSPSQDNYLVIQIKPVTDKEFENVSWNFRNLENYSTSRVSAFPFTTSLTELMKNKIR